MCLLKTLALVMVDTEVPVLTWKSKGLGYVGVCC